MVRKRGFLHSSPRTQDQWPVPPSRAGVTDSCQRHLQGSATVGLCTPLTKGKRDSGLLNLSSYNYQIIWTALQQLWGFPCGSDGKVSAYSVGDLGSIPGLERSPGKGNGNPLQYSCLENPMDGGAQQATVHGVAKSQVVAITPPNFLCSKPNLELTVRALLSSFFYRSFALGERFSQVPKCFAPTVQNYTN